MAETVSWPRTPEQWAEAVDLADAALATEKAKRYGFLTGGPEVSVERAELILAQGERRGLRPRPGAVADFFVAMFRDVGIDDPVGRGKRLADAVGGLALPPREVSR